MLRQRVLEGLHGRTSLNSHRQISPGVLQNSIESGRGQKHFCFLRRVAPVQFCSTSSRDNGNAHFVRAGKQGSQLLLVLGFGNKLWPRTADGVAKGGGAQILRTYCCLKFFFDRASL